MTKNNNWYQGTAFGNGVCIAVRNHYFFAEVDRKSMFSGSLGYSTQIMEFEAPQAKKKFDIGVKVRNLGRIKT